MRSRTPTTRCGTCRAIRSSRYWARRSSTSTTTSSARPPRTRKGHDARWPASGPYESGARRQRRSHSPNADRQHRGGDRATAGLCRRPPRTNGAGGMKRDDQTDAPGTETEPMKRKEYEAELEKLHAELVKLQQWVVAEGLKVCIVFEGRDTAGKGGTIKAIMERVSPRVFRVVALPAPTEREKSQMYMQRYMRHLPAGGQVVIFDRSWYNRAGVERVMGFASEDKVRKFLDTTPLVERA